MKVQGMRIAVVEDEQNERDTLKGHLEKYDGGRGEIQVSVFTTGFEFIENYRSQFDLVFMDIEMPHLDGMSAAEKLREIDPFVMLVFVTNLKQYAIKGYSVQAIDFLVKPVSYYALSILMNKAKRIMVSKKE